SKARERIRRTLSHFDPQLIVFCRYSGPHSDEIIDWARRSGVPILYHIDDDLLAIPPEIGARKHALHNQSDRLEAVRTLLTSADLVYASTENLRARLLDYFPDLPVEAGKIYCAGAILQTPELRPARKVGYMASADHAHNLAMIIPAMAELLQRHDHVSFEFFGSIPVPVELERFGDRVTTAPPVTNYAQFLEEFAGRNWDVGICPLVPIPFNLMKADTKWVEYSSVGTAVVASRGTVYDVCCADGCGLLADTQDEWLEALELLVTNDQIRVDLVKRAQRKLQEEYNIAILREQVLGMFETCRERAKQLPRRLVHEEFAVAE
ncbi:MAG: glycosyltransferase, partial [Sphingomonas sp.]|nr:glycosyltransferase [Sphingomonas sp.]